MSEDLCVRRVPIFSGLNRPEQEAVAEFARPQTYRRDEILLRPGQTTSKLFVVHSGHLKVFVISANGQEQILRTVGMGEVVGEDVFLTGQSPEYFVEALDDTRVCVFDHHNLAELLSTYPLIGQEMLRSLAERLTRTENLLAAVTSQDVGARVAAYLLGLGADQIKLPLARKDIAAYLGTTPETLSRRLRAFQDAKWIKVEGRRITILDRPALSNLSATSGAATR